MTWYRVDADPSDVPWVPAVHLLSDSPDALDAQLSAVGSRLCTDRCTVPGSLLVERHTWALATAAFHSLLRARRVPDLAAGNVSIALGSDGRVEQVLLRTPRFAALVGPSCAAREAAVLRWLMLRMVDDHLALLVARLCERPIGRSGMALWGLVADSVAAAIVDATNATGTSADSAMSLIQRVCDLVPCPLRRLPRVLSIARDRGTDLIRKRVTCCLSRTLAGQESCATCSLVDDETTRTRVLALRTPGLARGFDLG